jgi:hypothetical protein
MITVQLAKPTVKYTEALFKKFNARRDEFGDELASDILSFYFWIFAEDSAAFSVYQEGVKEPIGLFLFTGIEKGMSCFSHVFMWDLEGVDHAELLNVARITCRAVLDRFELNRISGLTPVTHPHARVFAEQVGYKIEGKLRKAVRIRGKVRDAWISGLTAGDIEAAFHAASADTMKKEAVA